uniref:Uncharacterized protein n=1 Tax=Phakopsora pachyrhizi TaxID=170000 RepID=A0A0S1MK02_PHAPC
MEAMGNNWFYSAKALKPTTRETCENQLMGIEKPSHNCDVAMKIYKFITYSNFERASKKRICRLADL